MGLHKLEIEVTDETLARIDAAAARTNSTRADVVAEKLEDFPPADEKPSLEDIERRRAFLRDFAKRTENLGPGRSQEDIDRQVREFRADREI